MTDLVAFLRARLDEDKATADAATPGPWSSNGNAIWRTPDGYWHAGLRQLPLIVSPMRGEVPQEERRGNAALIARHDPARVLREVEAKRRIVDELAPLVGFEPREDYDNTDNVWAEIASKQAERHLRLLAAVYEPAWAPE